MCHLWEDKGQTWSQWIWPQLICKIPMDIIPGMTFCAEHLVQHLTPFYQGIVHNYTYLNRLDVWLDRSRNIWATELVPSVNRPLITAGFVQIGDLPFDDGVINYRKI